MARKFKNNVDVEGNLYVSGNLSADGGAIVGNIDSDGTITGDIRADETDALEGTVHTKVITPWSLEQVLAALRARSISVLRFTDPEIAIPAEHADSDRILWIGPSMPTNFRSGQDAYENPSSPELATLAQLEAVDDRVAILESVSDFRGITILAEVMPESTGAVFNESSSVKDVNDRYPRPVWIFTDTGAKVGLSGRFRVPDDYVDSPSILLAFKSTGTSGNGVWDFDYTAVADGESADPSTDQESVSVTVAIPGTARLLKEISLDLTAANFAPGDWVLFNLSRDCADAADTVTGVELILEGACFTYSNRPNA